MTDEEYFEEMLRQQRAPQQPPRPQQPQQPKPQPKTRGKGSSVDVSMSLVLIAVLFILVPVGGLFFAVNGGYSIVGLETIANAFNAPGRFLWASVSALSFRVPVSVMGLPETQPAVPWCIVIGTSLLQVVTSWRKLTGRSVPRWLMGFTIVISGYDIITTFVGFGTVPWIITAGILVQVPLAVLFTFGFEGAVSFLLRKV